MRPLFTLALAAFFIFAAQQSNAQNKENPNAISARLNFLDYGVFYNQELHLSEGFELGYFRNVHKYVNVGIPVKIGLSKLPTSFSKNMVTFSGDVVAQVCNTNTTSKFLPFAFAGLGIAADDLAGAYLQAPVGGGIQYKIGKYASLVAQAEFRKALADNYRDNFQGSIGFVYLLHPPDPRMLDADADGTPDALDKCPNIAGPATALGCPDKDKDGVSDKEDQCPEAPGPLETAGCPDADGDGYQDAVDKCPDIQGVLNGCPDTDKDGFADMDDECPTEAGRWNGCPDTDLDGIADKNDKCPTEAGSVEHNGCPEKMTKDTDGDGFNDDADTCPDMAGTANGCPDADADGIADKDDACPEKAGISVNKGCPKVMDTDGDGFSDETDACPGLSGTVNGCPDSDNDGIADKDDACPEKAGIADNKGCPKVMDTDGDGFNDENDACPGQPGAANGCPDQDNDGVADKDDACPSKPGTADNKGCPKVVDTDGDGFNDENDACPGQPGTANGCPDQDRDGIADKDDLCPTEAGGSVTKGCPDMDSDGTADKYDLCPDKPGAFEGCPDTDRDGTPDHKDACASEAGPASNKGCPVAAPVVVTAKDTDGDGVNDDLDKCPTSAGPVSNNGCPEIRKETKDRLTFAMQAVQFETGKAMLKGESYAILDEIVGILRQYPDYKLAISGHTDNIGDDAANLRLSSDRAKTCYDYFAFRGISTARLRFAGFGEMRPIANNETPTGREMNRRVEFELTLD